MRLITLQPMMLIRYFWLTTIEIYRISITPLGILASFWLTMAESYRLQKLISAKLCYVSLVNRKVHKRTDRNYAQVSVFRCKKSNHAGSQTPKNY